jgi:hypothetical protein
MQSYPTPAGAANEERMSPGFLKLHPGPPVHVFTRAEDREFHDHPFPLRIHVMAGSYIEQQLVADDEGCHIETYHRQAGHSHEIAAGTMHMITELPEGFCVTRAEYGPKEREPGFYEARPDGLYHRYWHESEWQRWPRPIA